MAASTMQRPTALPQPKATVPEGAAKLAKIYMDDKGLPQKSATPVPVDADERRTPHLWLQCPHLRNINGGGRERCPTGAWRLPDAKPGFCPHHGKEMESTEAKPSVVAAVMAETVRLHGRSAAPWAIPATALLADVGFHAAHLNPLGVAVAAPVVAAGAYVVTKRMLTARSIKRGRIEKGQREGRRVAAINRAASRYAALGAEAGMWAAMLAAADPTSLPGLIVAAAGMLRWAFVARDWWKAADERRDRGPEVRAEVPAPTPEPPDPVKLRAVTTWVALIGSSGGPLSGTELVDFTRLPACDVNTQSRTMLPNWSAKVVAKVEGSINMRENRPALLGRIAAAYKCTYADVSFHADEADLSVGWVRVQPDNPLAEIRMWTGPNATNWKAGTSVVGRFDDGRAIPYQWYDEGGACHDLLGGCSGSGKSELVAQMILTSLHSDGRVLDWVGDPQRGQSYGALKDKVDWFARDKTEIKLMLLAAVKEMFRRNDELSRRNIKTWHIGLAPDMPLLVITLDEVQAYIEDPDILELVTQLAGMARKCGIKLRLITQIIAAYNLGGDTYIKEQVKTGQTFTFRAETDVAGRSAIEGDSPIDPTALPKKWGAYTCAAGKKTAGLVFVQGVHGRDVYGRTDFTGDDMTVWLVDSAGRETLTPAVFCDAARRESGVLWGDRHQRARRLLEAGLDDANLLPNGRALELIEQAAVAAATDQPIQVGQPAQAPLPDRARDAVLKAAQDVADKEGLASKKDIVRATTGQVAETTVSSALTDLVADGGLRRVKNGVYEVPGLVRARQLELEVPAQ